MDKLESIFSELRSSFNSPAVYLVKQFDEIRNQIDTECQVYLNIYGLDVHEKEKAVQQQQAMINEVNSFQKKCLDNLETSPSVQPNVEELGNSLRCLNLPDKEKALELEMKLYCEMYERKKALYVRKGIIFFRYEKFERFFRQNRRYQRDVDLRDSNQRIPETFGVLILIEDEFLIESEKTNQIIQ